MKKNILFLALSISVLLSDNLTYERDNTNEIVFDYKNNIVWQDNLVEDKHFTFNEAQEYCNNLELNNYKDWRIPSIKELESIIDYNKNTPAIKGVFKNTLTYMKIVTNENSVNPFPFYWSSTYSHAIDYSTVERKKDYLYSTVSYLNGESGNSFHYEKNYIRCVSNLNISHEDKAKKLIWQDTYEVSEFNLDWKEANKYCNELNLNGYNNWRLPTIKELVNIFDRTKYNPAINNKFKFVNTHGYYWSSTSYVSSNDKVWTAHYLRGNTTERLKDSKKHNYVRCVRN